MAVRADRTRDEGRTDMAGGELTRRVLVAAVGIPVTILLIGLGSWYLGGVMAVVAAAGAREYFALARTRDVRAVTLLGVAAAAALPLLAAARPTFSTLAPWALGSLLALTLVSLASVIWIRGAAGAPMEVVGTTVAGALYTGGTLAFAVLLRHLVDGVPGTTDFDGAVLVALPLSATWLGDSCAYFAGKRWGRRKLIPSVSPGKTVVGGVAGLGGAMVAAVVVSWVGMGAVPHYAVGPVAAAGIGLVIGVGAQVGDLAESVLKRQAGVKDSGSLLPGHGGALDRFDALFFTIPLSYVLVILYAGLG